MPALQEQDEDFTGPHAVRGQAALPGAGGDEYCSQDVYETIWHHGPIEESAQRRSRSQSLSARVSINGSYSFAWRHCLICKDLGKLQWKFWVNAWRRRTTTFQVE